MYVAVFVFAASALGFMSCCFAVNGAAGGGCIVTTV